MTRYWVYLNDEVGGPYGLDQLIRLRGFSRQTQVCVDDASGKPTHWISPAEIPELAHIFKAVDEQMTKSPSAPSPKPTPKSSAPRSARPYTPAVTLKPASRDMTSTWVWVLVAAALLGGAYYSWSQYARRGDQAKEQAAAKVLVENTRLPPNSLYASLSQYMQEKKIEARWEFQRMQEGLYHITLSWYGPALTVYAFEVNMPAQSIRGLNTAAVKLLSEGFPPPLSGAPKPVLAPKKSAAELFSLAIESRREALEKGDFDTVWASFSRRKKSAMAQSGISRDGFIRLQGLTHRVDAATKQSVLKTKEESDTDRLVLLKQSQSGQPNIFVKQLWVFENGEWKLDDEQKRGAEEAPAAKPDSAPSPQAEKPAASAEPPAASPPVVPATLPGMAH